MKIKRFTKFQARGLEIFI